MKDKNWRSRRRPLTGMLIAFIVGAIVWCGALLIALMPH